MGELAPLLSIVIPLATVLAVLVGFFKYKPGQRETLQMGAFEMVTAELEDQFKRMSAELKALRVERAEDRARIDTLGEDLMTIKRKLLVATDRMEKAEAERDKLLAEREVLTDRIDVLEERVRKVEGT